MLSAVNSLVTVYSISYSSMVNRDAGDRGLSTLYFKHFPTYKSKGTL